VSTPQRRLRKTEGTSLRMVKWCNRPPPSLRGARGGADGHGAESGGSRRRIHTKLAPPTVDDLYPRFLPGGSGCCDGLTDLKPVVHHAGCAAARSSRTVRTNFSMATGLVRNRSRIPRAHWCNLTGQRAAMKTTASHGQRTRIAPAKYSPFISSERRLMPVITTRGEPSRQVLIASSSLGTTATDMPSAERASDKTAAISSSRSTIRTSISP